MLRIALYYFAMVPVQRWFNVTGIGLLVLATLFLAFGNEAIARAAPILSAAGVIAIALTPAVGGGMALRFASTPSLLHLRPRGRLRLVAGTTLAITLVAALFTLPALATHWFESTGHSFGGRNVGALAMFMGAWTVLVLMWICMFAVSRSMIAFALIGLVPVVGVNLGKLIAPLFPDVSWVFAAGLVTWALFAMWYLTTRFVSRPAPQLTGGSGAGLDSPALQALTAIGAPDGNFSRDRATYYYLFAVASPRFFAVVGTWVALLFVLVAALTGGGLFGPSAKPVATAQLLAMLPFFAFFGASIGYTTARRMRLLWLRTPMDRRALFALAERTGLRSVLLAWVIVGALVLAFAVFRQPARTLPHVLFVALQAAVTIAMYYVGIGAVRRPGISELVLVIFFTALFLAQAVALMTIQGAPLWALCGALAAAALLIVALRRRALRRWRVLDWRVARLSRMAMG